MFGDVLTRRPTVRAGQLRAETETEIRHLQIKINWALDKHKGLFCKQKFRVSYVKSSFSEHTDVNFVSTSFLQTSDSTCSRYKPAGN